MITNRLENLYAAGVDFGGADADVYNVVMSGHGFGFAVNSGRIAGENAVKALKRINEKTPKSIGCFFQKTDRYFQNFDALIIKFTKVR